MLSRHEPASGVEEQRPEAPEEGRLLSVDGGPQRRSQTRRPFLGVVLPVVAGATLWLVPTLWDPGGFFAAGPFAIVATATILLNFMGAALLRSWWALLIVPAAWALGVTLTSLVVSVALYGVDWLANRLTWMIFLPLTGVTIVLESLPVLIFAGLGVFFSLWSERHGR